MTNVFEETFSPDFPEWQLSLLIQDAHLDMRCRWRSHPSAGHGLPLALRSAGEATAREGFYERFRRPLLHLVWTRSGAGTIRIDGKRPAPIESGMATIGPFDRPYGLAVAKAPWRFCWLTVDGIWAPSFPATGRPLQTSPCPVRSFRRLYASIRDDPRLPELSVAAYGLLLAAIARERGSARPAEHPAVTDACRLIGQRFDDPNLNVETLAGETGVHRSQLSRLFTRHLGRTPIACITSTRLQRAAWMLAHGDQAVTEVARRCGFTDPDYFSRAFSRHFGCAPRLYRKRIGNVTPM